MIKQVVEIGNGAAVYVPKVYLGQEVVLILPEGIQEIQQRVLTSLVRYMPNILGVYLYGSYARNEQQPASDVDVLVIVKEKDAALKKHLSDADVRVLSLDTTKKAMKEHPLFIVPIIREAKAFLNPALLEELRALPLNPEKFQWPLEEIKRTISIIETFLALDRDGAPIAPTHMYSLILRIRACFLINCLLHNRAYTTKSLREQFMKQGFKNEMIERWFSIYGAIRDNEEPRVQLTKEEIFAAIAFLKTSVKKLKHETKKAAGKGH